MARRAARAQLRVALRRSTSPGPLLVVAGIVLLVFLREPVRGYMERRAAGLSEAEANGAEPPVELRPGAGGPSGASGRCVGCSSATSSAASATAIYALRHPVLPRSRTTSLDVLERGKLLTFIGVFTWSAGSSAAGRRHPDAPASAARAGLHRVRLGSSRARRDRRSPRRRRLLAADRRSSAFFGFTSRCSGRRGACFYGQIIPAHVRTLGGAIFVLGGDPGRRSSSRSSSPGSRSGGSRGPRSPRRRSSLVGALIDISAAGSLRARHAKRDRVADGDGGVQAREGRGRRQAARVPGHRGRVRRRAGAVRRRLRGRGRRDHRAARDERRGEVDAAPGDQRECTRRRVARSSSTDATSRTSRRTRSPSGGSSTCPAAAGSSPGYRPREPGARHAGRTQDPDEDIAVRARAPQGRRPGRGPRDLPGPHGPDEPSAGALSGGEQQMVSLAQAFLQRPRLLLIDELSLGLSPAIVQQLLESVQEINARGVTIVVVEQSVNVALTIAERAIFMEKGEVKFVREDEGAARPSGHPPRRLREGDRRAHEPAAARRRRRAAWSRTGASCCRSRG